MKNNEWVIRAAFSWTSMFWTDSVVFLGSCRFFNSPIRMYVESNGIYSCMLHWLLQSLLFHNKILLLFTSDISPKFITYLGYGSQKVEWIISSNLRVSGKGAFHYSVPPQQEIGPMKKRDLYVKNSWEERLKREKSYRIRSNFNVDKRRETCWWNKIQNSPCRKNLKTFFY